MRRLQLRRRARCRRGLGQERSCSTTRARAEFAAFFARDDTFALGVCNGCQMMSNLHVDHPRRRPLAAFRAKSDASATRRASSPSRSKDRRASSSPAWKASVIPIAIAHGEGYAEFADAAAATLQRSSGLVARASSTTTASPPSTIRSIRTARRFGITALTTTDGRVTIMMPHPERVFRTVHELVASARLGRGLAVDADVQERAIVVGLNENGGSR